MSLALAACQAITQQNVALAGYTEMSTAFKSLEKQYAVEVVKVNADEGLLKRLRRGMRDLKEAAEPTGQCSDGTHFQIPLGRLFILTHRCMCGTELLCLSACKSLFLLVIPPSVPVFLACRLEHPMETPAGCCGR